MDVTAASTVRDFLADIITETHSVANGNGLDVFYWEPEAITGKITGLALLIVQENQPKL